SRFGHSADGDAGDADFASFSRSLSQFRLQATDVVVLDRQNSAASTRGGLENCRGIKRERIYIENIASDSILCQFVGRLERHMNHISAARQGQVLTFAQLLEAVEPEFLSEWIKKSGVRTMRSHITHAVDIGHIFSQSICGNGVAGMEQTAGDQIIAGVRS